MKINQLFAKMFVKLCERQIIRRPVRTTNRNRLIFNEQKSLNRLQSMCRIRYQRPFNPNPDGRAFSV